MDLDFSSVHTWGIVASVIGVDLLLSGDNAVVIALASRRLQEGDRRKALIFGTLGAVVLLIVSATIVSFLIRIPYLQAIGGALLAWIALKLLVDGGDEEVEAAPTLGQAIRTIIIADAVMSFDNMIAVAGTSHGHPLFIAMGLVVSIPIIILGGSSIGRVMDRFPIVAYLGAGFLGWTSGHMIVGDKALEHHLSPAVHLFAPFVEAALVLLIGYWIARRRAGAADSGDAAPAKPEES